MPKKMLIDATHPEETRVVVVDGNKVDDFDFESINKRQLAGNIYLAKVTRVEPSLQAAFVDYGGNRHGFLAFAEIHPDYYQIPVADREAILAEEEQAERAEAEAEAAAQGDAQPKRGRGRKRNEKDKGEDKAEEKPASRSRRGSRSKARSAEETASSESTETPETAESGEEGASGSGRRGRRRGGRAKQETAGALEVIDLAPDGGAESAAETEGPAPKGLEVAESGTGEAPALGATEEPATAAETAAEETRETEPPADETRTLEPEAPAAPETVGTETDPPAGEAVPAEEAATGAPDETTAAPEPAAPPPETAGVETAGRPDAGDPDPLDAELPPEAEEAPAETLSEALNTVPEDAVDAPEDIGAAPAPEPETAEPALTEEPVVPTPETPENDEAEPGSADDADGEGDDRPKRPRSMSESAGLDDETVSEDVAELDAPAEKTGKDETAEKPSRSRRGRRGTKSGKDGDKADTVGNGDREKDRPRGRRSRAEPADDEAETDAEATPAPQEVESAGAEDVREEVIRERSIRKRRYKIQDVIKVRQIMLVQVVKEERGNKGAALTTYLSLAGRYCVLMPNTARGGGISRKITNAPDRKRLREIVGELDVPRGMGLIVRTAGAERTRPEIKRDYDFLLRQWEQIRELTLKSIAPCLIYEEGSLIKRAIRDLYNREIDSVLVEGEAGYREAKDYMKMLMPSHARNVQQYSDPIPLYIRYQVESYLNAMFSPTVQLKSGGYIVIGVTEALVAIDVNSGRSTKEGSVEDTATKTNLEAADEIARQLRLRDLAGLIVIDFIDMDENRNNRAVEKRIKDRLKTDRARIQLGRISAFGLLEMSRQRLRPGMLEASTQPCPHCHGTGTIRSDESLSLAILREVEEEAIRERTVEVTVTAPVEIANFLINGKRAHIARIEQRHGVAVRVFGDPQLVSPNFTVEHVKAPQREAQAPAQQVVTAESGAAAAAVVEAEPEAPARPRDAESRAPAETDGADGEGGKSRRRRGKRGGKRRRGRGGEEGSGEGEGEGEVAATEAADAGAAQPAGRTTDTGSDASASEVVEAASGETADGEGGEERKPRRSRGGRGRKRPSDSDAGAEEASAATGGSAAESAEGSGTASAEEAGTAHPATAHTGAETMAERAAGPSADEEETAAGDRGEDGPPAAPGEDAPLSGSASASTGKTDAPERPKRKGWWTFGF